MNSSLNSEYASNHDTKDINHNSRKPRLSSASKKSQEHRPPNIDNSSVDEFSNETQRKSSSLFEYDKKQLNHDAQINYSMNVSTYDENNEDIHKQESRGLQTHDKQKLHDSISVTEEDFHTISSGQLKTKDSDFVHPSCQYFTEKKWLDLQWHENDTNTNPEDFKNFTIKKPDELEEVNDPPKEIDEKLLDRIQGSIIGLALGDALGAHVEFRPYAYMKANPVTDLDGGGTWGLKKGQFTDDTSMALCLANSLLARCDFIPYDQLVRYKWWYKFGYMSSTGQCFDIGAATSQSLREFELRQKKFAKENNIPLKQMDKISDLGLLNKFDSYCSEDGVAGNGALMRLAPVPLFFYHNKYVAVEFSGRSGQITHGDKKAYDACRFYGALIVATLNGFSKTQILAKNFYSTHRHWFGNEPLHEEIIKIAEGSYKKDKTKNGYEQGIRGKGYIVNALEAALWAFWSDEDSFKKGALSAVNLGDDTDTTAAIYGQLAGAYYGYKKLPPEWLEHVYAREFLEKLGKWIAYEGKEWNSKIQQSFANK